MSCSRALAVLSSSCVLWRCGRGGVELVIASLPPRRDALSHCRHLRKVKLRNNNLLGFVRGGQDLPPRVDDGGMAPSLVRSPGNSCRGSKGHERLLVDSSSAPEQLPVKRPRMRVECAWIDEQVCSFRAEGRRVLRETQVLKVKKRMSEEKR
eukprot:CAMPEP_0185794510 /NCGR_PEP_ID=MMETSP1174-20130828/160052_1 /TAXON_ID=35687 /ORGANISM="Dictyocha speculum, Strain CCMP1381" /LENGTH=151 /DNA_ID=CAMNT_0028489743 /DNA_START=152 /DNA_END=607 /DNA_ORIENTATION=+